MLLAADPSRPAGLADPNGQGFGQRLVYWIAASWGACAFFPVGLMYLHFLLMLLALALSGDIRVRLRRVRASAVFWPLVAVVGWTLVVVAVGPWFEDTPSRVFHVARVALVLAVGVMLSTVEARAALWGFVMGAAFAALVVAAHHAWGLPDWRIWSSLLVSRNNFSSGNMISMAAAFGVCLVFAVNEPLPQRMRWLMLALAFWFAFTVALYAVSRNAHILLPVLVLSVLVWRFRSLRVALAGAGAVTLAVLLAWQVSPNLQVRIGGAVADFHSMQTTSNYSTSVGARWRMYQEALDGMLAHPVWGTGVGSWLPHWRTVWSGLQQNLPPELDLKNSEINNPHNDFLLTGMETGVPGLLFLVWLSGTFLVLGWKRRSTGGGMTLVLGVTIVVTGMLNAPFRDAALGMTLLWLLGAAVASHGGAARE